MSGYLRDRANDLQQELDEWQVGDELQTTNQILMAMLQAQTNGTGTDLGYYSGGQSTASAVSPDRATDGEEGGTDRQNYSKTVTVGADDDKDDPAKVDLPFTARLLDLRGWSGTVSLALSDPADNTDGTVWTDLDASNYDPATEIPARTSTVWLASDGSSRTPTLDVWRHRP